MKRAGIVMSVLALLSIVLLPVSQTFKFFIFGFGVIGGIVLIGIANYASFDD